MRTKLGNIFMLLSLSSQISFSQDIRFPRDGVIEFEKTVNTYFVIESLYGEDVANYRQQIYEYKKTFPQFRKSRSILYFTEGKSLYKPIPDPAPKCFFHPNPLVEQFNTIYRDYATNRYISQKEIYDDILCVSDSLSKVIWKLTEERRYIAGYNCRRANGLIHDSVYVVAFYTDEIHISGGPESFGGLPGMILGVAIPHEHVTWFANVVSFTNSHSAIIKPPEAGRKVNEDELKSMLIKTLRVNGREKYLKWWIF